MTTATAQTTNPTDDDIETQAYQQFDLWDEEQILEELQGIPVARREKWAYDFSVDGKTVTGVSWVGIKAARDQLAKQGIVLYVTLVGSIQDTDTSYQAVAQATSDKLGAVIGGAEQSKTIRIKAGTDNPPRYEMRPDDKAYAKCISKAQRNALINIIPTDIIDEIVRLGLEAKRAPRTARKPDQAPPVSKPSGVSAPSPALQLIPSATHIPVEYRNAVKLIEQLNSVFDREGIPFAYSNHYHLQKSLDIKTWKGSGDEAFWFDVYTRALAHGRDKTNQAARATA